MNINRLLLKHPEISLIKEYSGLFLVFPSIVAGFYQFGILISINANLITFFSVTSLAKDGVILTFQCLVLFVLSYLYRLIIARYIYKKYRFYLKFVTFITAALGFSLLSLTKYFVLENYAYALLYLSMFLFINHGIFFKKDIFSISGIYIGQTFMILMIHSTLAQFPNYQIRNIEELDSKVSAKYPKSKLLYFNDQYLFYSLNSFNPWDPKKDILIVKIDEIFDSYQKDSE